MHIYTCLRNVISKLCLVWWMTIYANQIRRSVNSDGCSPCLYDQRNDAGSKNPYKWVVSLNLGSLYDSCFLQQWLNPFQTIPVKFNLPNVNWLLFCAMNHCDPVNQIWTFCGFIVIFHMHGNCTNFLASRYEVSSGL